MHLFQWLQFKFMTCFSHNPFDNALPQVFGRQDDPNLIFLKKVLYSKCLLLALAQGQLIS